MKIKKYVAKSMPEAMNLIKKDLGKDAVILNSKEIKTGGIFGMFKKKNIEVIAALDENIKRNEKVKMKQKSGRTQIPIPREKTNRSDEVLVEIKHLKQLIASQSFQSEHNYPAEFEHVYQFLLEQEVNKDLAKEIVDAMIANQPDSDSLSRIEMKSLLKNELEKHLNDLQFDGIDYDRQIIQFVGPTGVGKTTTLAKVAAQSILQHEKKIAFITADTYRIAAIEQLKMYARILDVPLEVAYSIEDYKNALDKFQDYDIIFVDTAGRNFRDERYVHELKEVISFESLKVGTYLVLSLTMKAQDMIDIYHQFDQIPIEKVIFTKMDETITYGSILNICMKEKIGVAHFTNGQNVPDDIVFANPSFISDLIVSRYENV